MDQPAEVLAGPPTDPDAHLQGIQRQVGAQRAGQLPADHPPREHVDDEGGIHPAGEGPAVGDVGDPQLVGAGRSERAVDQVRAGVRATAGHGGPRAPRPADPAQTPAAHQPGHGAAGHPVTLPAQFGVHLAHPVDAVVVAVDLLDDRGGRRVGHRPRRRWSGPVRVVGARGDLRAGLGEDAADRLDPVFELVAVDEGDDQREGRSSSAAKKADALFRIAFARRSSRTSRSSSASRVASSVVVPGR